MPPGLVRPAPSRSLSVDASFSTQHHYLEFHRATEHRLRKWRRRRGRYPSGHHAIEEVPVGTGVDESPQRTSWPWTSTSSKKTNGGAKLTSWSGTTKPTSRSGGTTRGWHTGRQLQPTLWPGVLVDVPTHASVNDDAIQAGFRQACLAPVVLRLGYCPRKWLGLLGPLAHRLKRRSHRLRRLLPPRRRPRPGGQPAITDAIATAIINHEGGLAEVGSIVPRGEGNGLRLMVYRPDDESRPEQSSSGRVRPWVVRRPSPGRAGH